MLLQRVYHIEREKLLWEYTWEDIQEYIHTAPLDSIITINQGMTKDQIKTAYLEAYMDRLPDETISKQLERDYDAFERRLAEVKAK